MTLLHTVLVVGSLVLALVVAATLGWAAGSTSGRRRADATRGERDMLAARLRGLEEGKSQHDELARTLAPLTSSLARVERQVECLERNRARQLGELTTRLDSVHAAGEALRDQTAHLVGALRSPNIRGVWGEVQLRRVVEHAGLLSGVDFDAQVSGFNDRGEAVRPDAVVTLPGGKFVVVDAKAPMTAFLNAINGFANSAHSPADASAGERHLEAGVAHARALRRHVDQLAGKRYWSAFQPGPDVVVCFVPGESFVAAACEADPALLEHAMRQGVVLATPTTLLALLRTVAVAWQQDALTGSAKELLELGRELYQRIGGLGAQVGKLGSALDRAVSEYNATVGTLERRVLVSARRMHDLGLSDGEVDSPFVLDCERRAVAAPELLDAPGLDVRPGRRESA